MFASILVYRATGSYTVTRLSQQYNFGSDLTWSTATEGAPYTTEAVLLNLYIFMNGNVGIGTTGPGTKLM